MDNTFLGVIIGAIAGALPGIISAYSSQRDNQRQREHEIRMKEFDLIDTPRINAILNFSESIGKCISIPRGKIDTEEKRATYAEYLVAYERAYPFVSDSTREAMEKLVDPLNCSVDDPDIAVLNACLGNDLRNVFSDAHRPADCCNKQHPE